MAYVAQLLSPRVLSRLSEAQLGSIAAAVDAEILTNPTIRKAIERKIAPLTREMEATLKAK